jgi:hypothetical protein
MSGGDTTTKQQSTSSTQLPSWVNEGSQDIFGFAKNWAAQNPTYKPYAGDRTADFGSSWDPAKGFINSQIGQSNPDLNAARGQIQGVLGALDPSKGVSDYMNPFISGVVDPTIRKINQSFDKRFADLGGQAAAAGAFGDTGHAKERAMLARDNAQTIGDTTAGLYSSGYDKAQAQQNAVLQQIMSGAGAMAGIGNAQFQQGMTSANAGAGMGALEQGVGQKGLDSLMADWQKGQTWGGDQATKMAQILAMLPTNKTVNTTGTTTQPDNSGMALFGSILGSII